MYCGDITATRDPDVTGNVAIGQVSCYASEDKTTAEDVVFLSIPCAFLALAEYLCWTCTSLCGRFARAFAQTRGPD